MHPDDRAQIADFIRTGAAREEREFRYMSPAGRMKWLCSSVERVGADRLVGITFDITDRKLAQEEAMARRPISTRSRACRTGKLFAVCGGGALGGGAGRDLREPLLIDLDHLRDVNDAFGHDVGDAVIREVADRLQVGLRPAIRSRGSRATSSLSSLSTRCRLPHAVLHAEALIARLRQPLQIRDQTLTCRASIGVAGLPRSSHDLRELLKDDDIALSQAKVRGRDRVVLFAAPMRVDALPHGCGSPTRCAPPSRPGDRAVLPAEGLYHDGSDRRLRSPGTLAAPRERSVGPPGYSVRPSKIRSCPRRSATQFSKLRRPTCAPGTTGASPSGAWRSTSLPPSFASLTWRLDPRCLNRFGVPAAQFEVEVTETCVPRSGAETVPATLERLHASGIRIALDDFWEGFCFAHRT